MSNSTPALQGFGPNSGMDYVNGMDLQSDAGWHQQYMARVNALPGNGFSGDGLRSIGDDYDSTFGPGMTDTGGKDSLKLGPAARAQEDQIARERAMGDSWKRQQELRRNIADLNKIGAAAPAVASSAGDPFTFESSVMTAQGLKGPGDGFWRGFSGEGSSSVLEGSASFGENLGLTLNGMVTGPVRAAYGFVTEIGSQYKDVYNLLTRDGDSYTPSSAVANSLQRQGVGSTLLNFGHSVLSAPSQPVIDLLEGNYRAAGEGMLGTAALGLGAVRGVGLRLGTTEAVNGSRPNLATGVGYDAGDLPVRIQGDWSINDMKQGLLGHPPRGLGSPDLHHGGQMPGAAKHEVLPAEHRNNSALHGNRSNQGVTPEMRQSDRQLHWWYRAREQGADRLLPNWIYD